MTVSRKRAIRNYRSRLKKRGLARFEVLGRQADRYLSLARRLAEEGPDATRLRAVVSQGIAGAPPRPAASSPHCAALPSSAPISI
jgi:hypothetical protein